MGYGAQHAYARITPYLLKALWGRPQLLILTYQTHSYGYGAK